MSTRVGYRALIIDHETAAFRLAQFLTRPEYNNKIIQSVAFLETLNDGFYHVEQHDFLYIDPFAFNVSEALRFLAEVQARYPVKAVTLFRSGRLWQERLRDLEQMGIAPARLRTMLFLDKDLMVDAAFGQRARDNIMSMEREFLQELQRSGLGNDPLSAARFGGLGNDPLNATRSGVWSGSPWPAADFGPALRPAAAYDGPGASYSLAANPSLRDIVDAVVAALGRQSPNPTHPLTATPLLAAPQEWSQAQQQITGVREQVALVQQQLAQVQRDLPALQQGGASAQQQIVAAQGNLSKAQEQLTAVANAQRDAARQLSALDGRLRDSETRQGRLEQHLTQTAAAQRGTQTALWVSSGILAAAVLAAWIVLILSRLH